MRVFINRNLYRLLILFILMVTLVFNSGVKAGTIKIIIPEYVEVSDSRITLGDIARIEGVEGEKLAEIASVDLGQALLPGYEREIPRELISLAIQQKGYSPASFTLHMPYKVTVKTASRRVSSDTIIAFARDYLKEKVNCPAGRVEIIPRFNPPDLIIPDRNYSLEIDLMGQQELKGNVSLRVLLKIDGQVYKRVYLGFEVKLLQEVFVAKRNIKKGERLVRDDFSIETREIGSFRGELITDFNNRLVKEGIVNIPITRGSILTSYYLIIPDIVSFGDVLKAEVIVGNIRVSTLVKARENGKKGEYILVENLKTGYRFKAQVINSHLVRVIQP